MHQALVFNMKHKLFITGASGFTGQYLGLAATTAGIEVVASTADITQAADLRDELARVRPTQIIHLAAISFVAHSDPAAFYAVNTVGTHNLLQAIVDTQIFPTKVILASSANVYGNVPSAQQPITEKQALAPINHYAASKLAMEHISATYFDRLPIIITRPFNYTGVGQNEQFLVPKLIHHFVTRSPSITLGNQDVARDYTDVRAIAAMYIALLSSELHSMSVNLCTGISYTLRSIIASLEHLAGYTIDIKTDPSLVRSSDIVTLTGDSSTINGVLARTMNSVSAQIPERFEDTLNWMYISADKQRALSRSTPT